MTKELGELETLEQAGKDLTEQAFEQQLKSQGFKDVEKLAERIDHLKDKLGITDPKPEVEEEEKQLSKLQVMRIEAAKAKQAEKE